jgi:hypothetical protein
MDIGEPRREIFVEPIELPEPLRSTPELTPEPVKAPKEEPVPDGRS